MSTWSMEGKDADDKKKRKKEMGEHHDGIYGVYMAHKIQKLRNQNASAAMATESTKRGTTGNNSGNRALFAGVYVYVDGYTVPSKEEIRQLLLMHGGGFEYYETHLVTHMIATHLPASKVLQLHTDICIICGDTWCRKAKRPLPVVHPDWIVQSIAKQRLLPIHPFLYRGFADPMQNTIMGLSSSLQRASQSTPLMSLVSISYTPEKNAMHGSTAAVGEQTTLESLESSKKLFNKREQLHNKPTTPKEPDNGASSAESNTELEDDGDDDNEIAAMMTQHLEVPSGSGNERSAVARTNSTRDGPSYVRSFFAKSRLHHIGTWRKTFQQKAHEFQLKYKGPSIVRELSTSNKRVILHVDMDCFFVAVAVRDRPEFKNVPVAVAHSGNAGSSEISSCNYLARAKGIRAKMFMQTAKEICPELVVLSYKFDEIEQVSFQIYNIFFSHTPFVQAVSCDEAFLEFDKATNGTEKAKAIRQEILAKTRCTASVGVSYNILLAKLSSKEAKPNGIYQIAEAAEAALFLLRLDIKDLPGVGHRMSKKLEDAGLKNIAQLREFPKCELVRLLGQSSGEMVWNYAHGVDTRPLSMESNMMRKSVSAVINFGIRFETWKDSTEFLMALAEELQNRLQDLNVQTKCLTLFIKKRREGEPIEPAKFMGCGLCDKFSKSIVLADPTNDAGVIGKACIDLLRQFHFPSKDLRGIGIHATKLARTKSAVGSCSNKLFKAWLSEPAQQATGKALTDINDQETKPVDDSNMTITKKTDYIPSLSEISAEVLAELPIWAREEILTSYRASNLAKSKEPQHTLKAQPLSTRTLPPSRLKENRPLQQSSHARNALDVKSNHVQPTSGNPNALNDIRMSQIDSEVYHALPFAIRNEINQYAKKSSSSMKSTVIVPQHKELEDKKAPPEVLSLQSIEELFENLVFSIRMASDGNGDALSADLLGSQSDAFDAIYSRILFEVENHALDRASQMLRYMRRKCSSASDLPVDIMKRGFNRVLQQVNKDVKRHFHGVLSIHSVAPL